MELETIADIKLAGRAMNDDWPVSPAMRQKVFDQLELVLTNGDPELRVAASKVILAADLANLRKREAERKRNEAEHARKLQLIELAHKLGLVKSDSGATGSVGIIAPESK
jgi:hypothetical protein